MKTILYVWKSPYPWDVRVEKICNSLYKNNFDVYLLARWSKNQLERETINGINIIRVGYEKPNSFTVPISSNPIWKKAIKDTVKELKPCIIMPREIMLAEACGKIGKKYGIPVIMDMAEHYPAAMKGWDKYYNNIFSRIAVHYLHIPELVEKKSVKLMDGIITVCLEQNIRLNQQYNFPLNKLEVVHNTPQKQLTDKLKYRLNNQPTVFGHHGLMSSEKSLTNLVKAFIIASSKNENIKLILAGEGASLNDYKKIVLHSAKNTNITFAGKYNFNELPSILESFDIGVIPYQVNDFNNHTIHNKLFDFFAAGKPVIVSNSKPLQRIVNETNTGVVVDCSEPESLSEAILKITEMDTATMSANALKASREKYNWEVDSKNMIKFLERFI